MVAKNQKALDIPFSSTVKLGGEVSIAIGLFGGGAREIRPALGKTTAK
jgi:hypothetical protein